jgi:hypothetical protein
LASAYCAWSSGYGVERVDAACASSQVLSTRSYTASPPILKNRRERTAAGVAEPLLLISRKFMSRLLPDAILIPTTVGRLGAPRLTAMAMP